ncbi:LPXTG_cell wall anchor domain-containing protein [Hexamita inflata]|uniref:LPXTG cell wall anchor domain-containing protein n=1 Tax=Hexamita inflata TaxID=28002 RepID=A0AA86TRK4_9EUKA|nr:LPXTG cell wall anchor domain-containing protein [Hexamita inflata]
MDNTKVVDLHLLQHLYKLVYICADNTCIIDVSPLSKLTQINQLSLTHNQITNAETLKHHKNFAKYHLSDQQVPTADELKFYNKILSVHSSCKQITKLILAEKSVSKFRELMTHQKEYIKLKINEQVQVMNKKIEIIFSQNYYTDQQ